MNRVSARHLAIALATSATSAGCDPIINLYGSFFPAWIVSLLAGLVLTVLLRLVFVATKLEAHLGLLLLVYPSLTLLLSCVVWLVLFRS